LICIDRYGIFRIYAFGKNNLLVAYHACAMRACALDPILITFIGSIPGIVDM
jgi:hypothetical protein